jgi:hypothetical protein
VCDRNATTATFASQFSAATAGQTICVASGSYGSFSGSAKSGMVFIRAATGATASMSLDFNGAANISFDGLTIANSTMLNSTKNIVVRNSTFTGVARFDGVVNSNILFDNNTHNNINSCTGCAPARIWLSYGSDAHSGVTIQNSKMIGGSADGIQSGPAINVINNEFANIWEGSCSACHTDVIQLFSGSGGPGVGSTIRGNYIHDSAAGIVAYDGTNDLRIEHNVVANMGNAPIIAGGDSNSIIQWNTVINPGWGSGIDLSSKSGMTSVGTIIRNNIVPQIRLNNGAGGDSRPASNTNNMVPTGGSGGNFNGNPTFTGGTNPTTYTGYKLTTTSPGKGRATDGTDVGI